MLVTDESTDKDIFGEFELDTDTVALCVVEPLTVKEESGVADGDCFKEAVSVIVILGDDEADGEVETVTDG